MLSLEQLAELIKSKSEYLRYNQMIFDIYRGKLLDYVEDRLKASLSGEALKYALDRVAPINVLRRIIDKESKLYSSGVSRELTEGFTENDQKVFSFMLEQMKPNRAFSRWNAYTNTFKNGLVGPYLNRHGIPQIRTIPSDRFIPFSTDRIDSHIPTGFAIYIGPYTGTYRGGKAKGKQLWYAITDHSYVWFTEKGEDVTLDLNPENDYVNEIGAIPFVYINKDEESILPEQDTDILAMTLLIPVILTDINYAHMFQSFSIVYGINLTDQGMKWGPNSFWSFKSDPGQEGAPTIGTLQPQADIDAGLSLVANEFALWLNTKGIKPGAVGEVNGQNFVSGISKILDEMDTSENRNEQIPYFEDGEAQFWDLTLKKMLPYWMKYEGYKGIRENFSQEISVVTKFSEQIPLVRRGQLVSESKAELDAGFTTRRRSLRKLNPTMTETELDALEAELDELKAVDSSALNGAQVTSLTAVLERVGQGTLPPESAIVLIISAFGLSEEVAQSMVSPIQPGSVALPEKQNGSRPAPSEEPDGDEE